MANATVEQTQEELRREIEELNRQRREITVRIRDPRGLRRGALAASGSPRNFGPGGVPRQRGLVRPADRTESHDEPAPKRRLSSAVVKVEDGEIAEEAITTTVAVDKEEEGAVGEEVAANGIDKRPRGLRQNGGFLRRDGNFRAPKEADFQATEPVPRVLPKIDDPKLVNRNRRMFGQLLGTLEKFRKEDRQLSGSEAYMKRSNSLQKAEQRAREESERLRQEERDKIVENRKRDLILRTRLAAKAEEKKLELLFLQWSEHHKKLSNFLRTKTEPPIYYMPVKPLNEDPSSSEQKKEEAFLEWKAARREELSSYQKQMEEQYVQSELERQKNAGKNRKINNNDVSLQENMDKELETHRLEHGPKRRNIPRGDNEEDDDDVEDINAGDDDLMDDVLGVEENNRRADDIDTMKPEESDIATDNPEQHTEDIIIYLQKQRENEFISVLAKIGRKTESTKGKKV
ncbi:hypothetical protein V2J09_020538 [Rumex salicifolius]